MDFSTTIGFHPFIGMSGLWDPTVMAGYAGEVGLWLENYTGVGWLSSRWR